jgi:predicted ATP-grasp superfamily ATP-dependent carboligase
MENQDVTTELIEMVRVLRGLGISLDSLVESVDRIASAVEEIRNLKDLERSRNLKNLKNNP